MQSSLGNKLSNALSLATGAAGVSWSGPEYHWIFEWIFYLSLVWAAISVFLEGWSNRTSLIRRLKMIEPSHVMVLGLLIALGGAIWQWQRPSPPDLKVKELQTQVDELKHQIVSTPTPASTPIAQKPSKQLFPDEKVKLEKLFSSVSEQLNERGLVALKFANNMHAQPMQTKAQIEQFITQTDAARTSLTDMLSNIAKIITETNNPKLSAELKEVTGWSAGYGTPPVDRFLQNLTNFRKNLVEYDQQFDEMTDPNREWIRGMLITQALSAREDAVINFHKWIQDCKDKMDAKRD